MKTGNKIKKLWEFKGFLQALPWKVTWFLKIYPLLFLKNAEKAYKIFQAITYIEIINVTVGFLYAAWM